MLYLTLNLPVMSERQHDIVMGYVDSEGAKPEVLHGERLMRVVSEGSQVDGSGYHGMVVEIRTYGSGEARQRSREIMSGLANVIFEMSGE